MYDFHYDFIKKNFVANLLLTDNVTNENNSKDVMKNLLNRNTCSTLVNIDRNFVIKLTKKFPAK